jgi:tetratricopeptide (TPR) repeat protein
MKGLPQGPPSAPTGDLWDHVLRVLELLGADVSFPLAFAALLHDAGKPRSVGRTPDRYTFYGHEHIGRRLAGDIAQRLKLSNAERERVEWLVEKHQILSDAPRMRQSKLKTLLAHPGSRELLDLHRADARASGRSTDHVDFCEKRLPIALPEPLLSGDDLITLGLKPGKIFKELLDAAWEAQLEDKIKTKAEAIEQVKKSLDEIDQGQTSQPRKSADELYQEARARWAKAVDLGVHDDEKVIYGVTPILEKALQENQKHVKSLALLSDLLMAAGADEEAIQLLARLLELEPDTTAHQEKVALLRQKRSKVRSDEIRHYLAMKWLTTEDW